MTLEHGLTLQRVLIAELPQIAEMLACRLAQAGVSREAANQLIPENAKRVYAVPLFGDLV